MATFTQKSVDGDVAFDIMGSYMMRITYMLREIELMTLVGVIVRIDGPRGGELGLFQISKTK